MPQAGRITWDEFQIPQAASTTFAKSGGFTSAGSVGGDKGVDQARSGGIESAGSLGATRAYSVARDGGIELGGVLGGSQGQGVPRAGGTVSAAQIGADGRIAVPRDGGIEGEITLSGEGSSVISRLGGFESQASLSADSSQTISRDGGIEDQAETGADKTATFSKSGGFSSTGSVGALVQQKARILWDEFEIPQAASTAFSKSGGIDTPGELGGDQQSQVFIFTKTGGIASTANLGGDVATAEPEEPPVLPPAPDTGSPGRVVQRRPRQRAPVKRKSVRQQHEAIENHAERLLKRGELPDYFTVGAQKAYKNMQDFYGPLDGRRIFIKKAIEQGHGATLTDKINDVYATGTTVDTRKKLQTRVQTRGVARPQVKILSRIGK